MKRSSVPDYVVYRGTLNIIVGCLVDDLTPTPKTRNAACLGAAAT
jgi:hypothetical protein